jgi:uncharacterized protein (TIGR00252 family)
VIGWLLRLSDSARHGARSRRWTSDQAVGRRGEDLAHRYLEEQGFRVVARNWRPSAGPGEIDLIAWEAETLVFVEVKTRRNDEFGAPDRNIDAEKRSALVRAARNYARRAGVPWDRVRFVETGGTVAAVTSGKPLEVKATVDLAGLEPDDVRVELVIGRVNSSGHLEDTEVVVLPAVDRQGSVATFAREVAPERTGRLGYALRVSPNHFDDPLTRPCSSLLKWSAKS